MALKSLGVLILLTAALSASSSAFAQAGKPAIEYKSLLNMGFAGENGDFQLDALHIIFPPTGYEQAMLTISKTSGEEVASLPLRLDSYLNFPVFGRFVPESKPMSIKLRQAGDFVLTIKLGAEVITRFPFSLVAEPDEDPYSPPKRFLREGPWRDFGYISLPMNNAQAAIRFNWWMSVRELPRGMTNPAITIHLMDNYKEMAVSRGEIRLKNLDWRFFSSELVKTKKPGTEQMTMRELVKRDGVYLLIVKANGTPIKSFRLETKNGRLQRAEQSRIDFEPHTDFISPRFIESRGQSGADYLVTDAYWVRRSGFRRSFPPTFAPDAGDQKQRISKKESAAAK